MLLVWGRRWYGKRLGYVGEFCEICRRPQPFTLTKMTLIGHFWYLPMGTHYGSVHRGRCLQCGTEIDTARERYGNVARRKAPARELLDATFPNHEQVLKARLEAERVVRGDPRALAPETRVRLVDLPFVILSPIRAPLRQGHADGLAGRPGPALGGAAADPAGRRRPRGRA